MSVAFAVSDKSAGRKRRALGATFRRSTASSRLDLCIKAHFSRLDDASRCIGVSSFDVLWCIMRAGERARGALDRRMAELPPVETFARPRRGWVRAIRDAIGMTSGQLAQRLGVTQSTVIRLEQSEVADTISLVTLRRAAAAVNCTLVYAFVPNSTLAATVAKQARAVAADRLAEVEHTMLLEAQDLDPADRAERLDRLAATLIDDRALWR